MKNKSVLGLLLFFSYAIYFGLFPKSFPEYTKCEKKELLRQGWNYIISELPRAKPLITDKCLIRIGNLQYLKATNDHFDKVIEIKNSLIEAPDYSPSIWNKVG